MVASLLLYKAAKFITRTGCKREYFTKWHNLLLAPATSERFTRRPDLLLAPTASVSIFKWGNLLLANPQKREHLAKWITYYSRHHKARLFNITGVRITFTFLSIPYKSKKSK